VRTIGVISDTHGLLRPEALAALDGSALILHAGDVGQLGILEELARIAPVHAVFGNTDFGEVRRALPRTRVVDLESKDGMMAPAHDGDAEGPVGSTGPGDAPAPVQRSPGLLAFVHHGDRELDLDPAAAGIALVVSGHTHRSLVEERGGVLWLNPGSAGPRRFTLPATVARVRVGDGGKLSADIVALDEGG
jgi:hypothetical protein